MSDKAILFHFGALGDLLISLPCIRLLKSIGYEVTLVASFPQALLLKELFEVDRAIDSCSSFLLDIYTDKAKEILKDYSKIFIFSKSNTPELSRTLKKKAIELDVIHTYPSTEISNYKYQLIQLLEKLSLSFDKDNIYDDYKFCFKPFPRLDSLLDVKRPFNSKIISVHLGSGSEVKNLPLSSLKSYIKTIDNLYRPKWFFITGPAESKERKKFVDIISSENKDRVRLLDTLPLLSLSKYIRSSSLFIGNDSGISHLAAFCGVNSVLCFGPTNPKIWAPPFKWVKVILSKKKCVPCIDYHKCEERDCMKEISLEELILATQEFIG